MLILNLVLINLFIIFFILLEIYSEWQNNNKIRVESIIYHCLPVHEIPFPENPGLQVHVKDPRVLLQ